MLWVRAIFTAHTAALFFLYLCLLIKHHQRLAWGGCFFYKYIVFPIAKQALGAELKIID